MKLMGDLKGAQKPFVEELMGRQPGDVFALH